MKKWKRLDREELHINPFWDYRREEFETPDGTKGNYYYHHDKFGAVDVYARLDDGRFVMINEYRYLFEKDSLTEAKGTPDKGESHDAAALRELEEETGYRASQVQFLGALATAPAFSDEKTHVFLATGLRETSKHSEATEQIDVLFMKAEEIDQAIADGKMWDSTAIAAWVLVKQHLAKGAA